jgi:tetratricopeptide (TPR) repeat protein
MKFICPVCKTTGDIPDHEDSFSQPATQTKCLKCGTDLSVEPNTGQVQRISGGQDLQEDQKAPSGPPKYAASSVLSMRLQDKGKKDYLATGVFAIISELVDDVTEYGKTIFREFQKDQQPRQTKRHLRKGHDYYKENRLKEALHELNLAIEAHPENAEAYFWRARTFIRLEQYDKAIADLKTVVNLKPRYSPAYDNLGWLFVRRNDYDESLSNLNKSIELKPDNGWAHYMRGRVFFNKGDFQKAVENAETACKLGYKDGCRDAKRYGAELNENG